MTFEGRSLYGPLDADRARAQVQMAVTAQVAALLAWQWPDDAQRLDDAIGAFYGVGLDYADLCATFIESTGGNASDATARLWVAEHLRHAAMMLHREVGRPAFRPDKAPDVIPDWMIP